MPSSSDAGAENSSPLRFGPMRAEDLAAVVEIEVASFPTPWNRGHFLHEMQRNPYSINRVLRRDDRVVGYVSVWALDGELQVNKIAIAPAERGKKLGRLLLARLLRLARDTNCRKVTLEVRPGNVAARKLYAGQGFRESGRRADYYGPGEHAVLMCRDVVRSAG